MQNDHIIQISSGEFKINSLDCSSDSRLIACAGALLIRFFDTSTWKQTGSDLIGHSQAISSIQFSQDSSLIVSGSADKTVKVWNVMTRTQIQQFNRHPEIFSVRISPNGQSLSSLSIQGQLIIHDMLNGPCIQGNLHCIEYSPDGQFLASVNSHNSLNFWNTRTHRLKRQFKYQQYSSIQHVKFSPNGKSLVVAQRNCIVVDLMRQKLIYKLPETQICTISFSPDGNLLVQGTQKGRVSLWDLMTRSKSNIMSFNEYIKQAQLSNDGKYVICVSSSSLRIKQLL